MMVIFMVMDLENILIISIGFIAILTSFMIIKSRNLVYAAVYLSLVGIFNAILIALLGYVIIAVLHIIIYVGAGIMFIIMSISMMREFKEVEQLKLPSLIIAILIALPIAYLGYILPEPGKAIWSADDYIEISSYIVTNYSMPIIVILLALASVLIASISITKGKALGDIES